MKTKTQTSQTVSTRQRAAARKAWEKRHFAQAYAQLVITQDGIEEALEALALGFI